MDFAELMRGYLGGDRSRAPGEASFDLATPLRSMLDRPPDRRPVERLPGLSEPVPEPSAFEKHILRPIERYMPEARLAENAAEAAALRTRESVRPTGGREESGASYPVQSALGAFEPLDLTPTHLPETEPKDYLRELYRNPDILKKTIEQARNFNLGGTTGKAGAARRIQPMSVEDAYAGIRGKYAGYADKYMPVPPPVLMSKKTEKPILGVRPDEGQRMVDEGTAFWSKGETPQTAEFMKDRAKVNKTRQEPEGRGARLD